ncbi:Drug/metabolite transporter [Kalmanozyma brasiliensis GHG001]|uniref:Drug/metabolite transporter n=1 Tax=Kalmanozyma brasiliensis (strain GHG001) TaxID=1365824 RepID=UPI001CE86D3E|nr:Drug/metabolite transporter [Kalmanozyma brasiliensis GHG001]EST08331.2 Drug/metabolite transporter [Kalmanozyma brasiliensis GHG001]
MSTNIFRDSYAGDPSDNDATTAHNTKGKKPGFMSLPGGSKAIFAFVLSLFAYTLQTEFAQYVQQSLNYRKPFLSLYLGHSAFLLLFPMHLFFLKWTTGRPITHYLHLIAQNLRWQLETPASTLPDPRADAVRQRLSQASGRGIPTNGAEWDEQAAESLTRRPASFLEQKFGFNVLRLAGLFAILTVGITVPALSWYCAVPMTSMADITAIYNTFSVWALVFSVWFLGEKWQKRKVFSVLLACFGVIVVAYGGADHRKVPKPFDPIHGKPPADDSPAEEVVRRSIQSIVARMLRKREDPGQPSPPVNSAHNPALGDLLAFIGAVTMAAYEMAFKLIGTLPDEQKQAEMYSAVPGGRNRRSRSYVRYSQAAEEDGPQRHETEGLLGASQSETRQNGTNGDLGKGLEEAGHHVLGDDEDEEEVDLKRRESTHARRYSTVADKLLETERSDYFTITPPPEPAQPFDDDNGGKTVKVAADKVRVHAKAVPISNGQPKHRDEDEESQITESELDEDEERLVLSGATRLHRTRSQLLTHPVSSDDLRTSLDAASSRPGPSRRTSSYRNVQHDPSIPPPLPFGLHANVMTAGIGLTTFTTFWILILAADALGWETLEAPHNVRTYLSLAMVGLCGIFFNAAFMILLSLWGPVLASVSCLMTTILVEIADVLLGHPLKWLSVLGCTLIGAGFAVLVGGDDIH